MNTVTSLPLPKLLTELRTIESPTDRVLSIYLDTSVSRSTAFRLDERDRIKLLRGRLPTDELATFESAAAQAERVISSTAAGPRGLAVFASGSPTYLFFAELPECPTEHVVWSDAPMLGPLQATLEEHQRFVTVLFDSERTRIWSTCLDQIEVRVEFADDVPARQKTGGWFGLANTHMTRHREVHIRRHAQRTIGALLDLLRRNPFDRLALGGPDEALSLLRRLLPRSLESRVAGTFHAEMNASDREVVLRAREIVFDAERQAESETVTELANDLTAGHVVAGLADTLAALADGRVHRLIVAYNHRAPGKICGSCGRLASTGERCSICGSALDPVHDVIASAVEQAYETGARTEIVRGEAASRLLAIGGIGAWTRY